MVIDGLLCLSSLFKLEQLLFATLTLQILIISTLNNSFLTIKDIDKILEKKITIEYQKDLHLFKIISNLQDPSLNLFARLYLPYYTLIKSGLLLFNNLIYISNIFTLYLKIIHLHYDSLSVGHFGHVRSFKLVSYNFYWLKLCLFIDKYVNFYDTY